MLASAAKKSLEKARRVVALARAEPRRAAQLVYQRLMPAPLARLYQEEDKRQHFGVSLLLFILCLLPCALLYPFWPGLALAAAVTLLVGLGKEVWDHFYGSGFCWFDMAANAAGIGLGIAVVSVLAAAGH